MGGGQVSDTTTSPADVARLRELRSKIAENDRQTMLLIGKRVKLVREVWKLKDRMGVPHDDPAREQWLATFLRRANFTVLSDAAVLRVADFLLDLTKDEA